MEILKAEYGDISDEATEIPIFNSQKELDAHIEKMEADMRELARKFDFERAAILRDSIRELRSKEITFG
jgi:excinuclease ABC subunit B